MQYNIPLIILSSFPIGGIIFAAGIILISLFNMIRASAKKGSVNNTVPDESLAFKTKVSKENSIIIIKKFASQHGHKIVDIDETKGVIILNEAMSMTSYGAFYSIYVYSQNDNLTSIQIGIKNKISSDKNSSKRFLIFYNGIKLAISQMENDFSKMKRCPNCKKEINDTDTFCNECGQKINQIKTCPNCKKEINDMDTFCKDCGQKIK